MKFNGVINAQLITALTQLGHTDKLLLCDAGFPVPHDDRRIDMALTAGIPSFMDCLKAILSEIVAEEYAVAKEMREFNPETFNAIDAIFVNQKKNAVPQSEFLELAKQAKFIVRSGELKPYSNILLTVASGVERFNKDFVVRP